MFRRMFNEFRDFALKGSVLDLAIGIIIGSAFTAVVNSLVADVIMPPFGLILGRVNFSDLFINLSGTPYASLAEAQVAGAPVIAYGVFLNTVLTFLIVAFVIFLIVRQVNRLQRPRDVLPSTKECPYCLTAVPLKATRCPACTSQLEM